MWLSCVAMLLACLMLLTACGEKGNKPDANAGTNTTVEEKLVYPEACDNHHGDFICENCGNRMTPNNFFEKFCGTDKEWTLVLENISVTIPDNNQYTYTDEEAELSTLTIKKGELSITLDGTNIGGYGVITDAVYTSKYTDLKVSGTATIKDSVVYLEFTSDSTNYEYSAPNTDADNETTGAVAVKEVCSTDKVKYSVYLPLNYVIESLIGQSDFVEIPSDLGNISDEAIETIENGLLLMAKAFVTLHPELEDMVARIADLFFTVTKNDDGYEVVLSVKKLNTLNNTFAEMTVSELVDYVVGEGTYDKLVAYINASYEKTMSQLLTELKTQGIDVVGILTLCKAIVPADTETHPILDAIRQLTDEDFLKTTVKELIISDKGDTDLSDNAYFDAVKAGVTTQLDEIKNTTVWDAVATVVSGLMPPVADETDDAGNEYSSDINGAVIHDMISAVLETLGENGVILTVDTALNGSLKSVVLELAIPDAVGGKISLLSDYKTTADLNAVFETVNANLAVPKANADKIAEALDAYFAEWDKYATIEYNKETCIATITMNFQVTENGEPFVYTFDLSAPIALAYENRSYTNSDETRLTDTYMPIYKNSTPGGGDIEDSFYNISFRIAENGKVTVHSAS